MNDSRWLPELPKMSFLEACEKDTLGHAYENHLKKNSLEIDFFPKVKINRPVDYVTYRTYVVHDLWHTLLGYDTTTVGEMEVQAFSMGQYQSPIALMIITSGFINLLDNEPLKAVEAFEKIIAAYERGKSCNLLLAYKLEDMLERPIEEVRKEVGLTS